MELRNLLVFKNVKQWCISHVSNKFFDGTIVYVNKKVKHVFFVPAYAFVDYEDRRDAEVRI